MKRCRFLPILLLSVVLVSCVSSSSEPNEPSPTYSSLVGINDVWLMLINPFDHLDGPNWWAQMLTESGLTKAMVREMFESKLRSAGLNIDPTANTNMFVIIWPVSRLDPNTFEVSVVLFLSGVDTKKEGPLWELDIRYLVPKNDLQKVTMENLNALLDSFVDDYQKANPE